MIRETCTDPLIRRFRYPTKMKVDENDVEVDFSGGVLTVTLKVVQIFNETTGKLMAFKGKTKSSEQPSKSKKSASKPESSDEDMDVSEDGAEESEDEQLSEESEEVKEQPKRKAKAPTSVRTLHLPHLSSKSIPSILLTHFLTDHLAESQRIEDFGRSRRR